MKMSRKNFLDIISIAGDCPKKFGLEELECSDERTDINCNMCWEHAVKDVKRIELEG